MSSLTMHVLLVDADRSQRKAASKLLRSSAKQRSLSCRIDRSPPEEVAVEALMKNNYHFVVLPLHPMSEHGGSLAKLRRIAKQRYVVTLWGHLC